MSEEGDKNFFSGNPSEIKITIIGGGLIVTKPTVIGGREPSNNSGGGIQTSPPSTDQKVKPTVIGGNKQPVVQEEKIVAHATKFTPASPTTLPKADKSKVDKPSAIPGTARKSLEIPKEELLKSFPGTSEEVLAQARKLLSSVLVDLLTDTVCIQWGVESQKKYSALVEESLALSSHVSIQNSSRHLMRLITLLQEVASTFNQKSDFKFWEKKDSPWEKFQAAHPEIKKISKLLNSLVTEVIDVRNQFDAIAQKYLELQIEIDASSIASKYLSDQLQSANKSDRAQRLLDRSLSLTQTVVNIRQGEVTRKATVQGIEQLISRIQNGVLVKLPAWIEQVSSFQSHTNLSSTDLYIYRQGLDEIVTMINK